VIDSTGIFYAKGTGHEVSLAEIEGNVKIKYLTLMVRKKPPAVLMTSCIAIER